MTQTYLELELEACRLPADERAKLADVLLDSLRGKELADIESEWATEIEYRIGAYERGEARLSSAEEVFAKARLIGGV